MRDNSDAFNHSELASKISPWMTIGYLGNVSNMTASLLSQLSSLRVVSPDELAVEEITIWGNWITQAVVDYSVRNWYLLVGRAAAMGDIYTY